MSSASRLETPKDAEAPRFTSLHSPAVDYVLRTVQQTLVQFSAMADAKANILITVSALVFTVGVTQLYRAEFRLTLLVLLAAAATSLVLAILCVRPSRHQPDAGQPLNLLFFLHFSTMPVERYLDQMDELLRESPQVYEAVLRDIHGQGVSLAQKKFRLLRWSYAILMTGFVLSAVVAIVEAARFSPH